MRTGIPQPWFLRELCAPLLEPSVVQQHSLPPSPVRRRLGDGGKSNTSGSLSFNFRLSTVSFPYQLPCFDILPNCSALRVTIAPLFSQPYKLPGVYTLDGNFRRRARRNLFCFMLLRALLHALNIQLSCFQLFARSFTKTPGWGYPPFRRTSKMGHTRQFTNERHYAVIPSPGRGRGKLREESLLSYSQQNEGFLVVRHGGLLGMTHHGLFPQTIGPRLAYGAANLIEDGFAS